MLVFTQITICKSSVADTELGYVKEWTQEFGRVLRIVSGKELVINQLCLLHARIYVFMWAGSVHNNPPNKLEVVHSACLTLPVQVHSVIRTKKSKL